MSLLLDSREMGVVNFQEQEKKKDDILVRGFTGYFGAGFHGKQGWVQEEKGRQCSRFGSESDEFSSESSSIGGCSDSSIVDHGGDEEDEVQSRFRSPLCQMDSLEDCLPVKRGLSNHFSGKAKSFGCLSDAISVKDLAKTENPLNKRRRLLLASKNVARNGWHGSFSDFSRQSLLVEKVVEEDEEEEDLKDDRSNKESEEEEEREESDVCISPLPLRRKFRSFISPRSLSLSDLHHA